MKNKDRLTLKLMEKIDKIGIKTDMVKMLK